jgi:hypothetical protein
MIDLSIVSGKEIEPKHQDSAVELRDYFCESLVGYDIECPCDGVHAHAYGVVEHLVGFYRPVVLHCDDVRSSQLGDVRCHSGCYGF